jgi:hypothetical protein
MTSFKRLTLGILLILVCASAAHAGRHYICYQDEDTAAGEKTAVWGCSTDAGEACNISGTTGYASIPMNPAPLQAGQYMRLKGLPSGRAALNIHFRDGAGQVLETRLCAVNIQTTTRGAASPNAVLVGFTTDASGLVSTGVWKLTLNNNLPASPNPFFPSISSAALSVPNDFVVVGGGVVGTNVPQGVLISRSMRDGDRAWRGRTADSSRADGSSAQPYNSTIFAIGMTINGLARDTLAQLVRSSYQSAAIDAAFSTVRSGMPFGFRLLGGGAEAMAVAGTGNWGTNGQYLTETAPGLCNGGNSGNCCSLSANGMLVCSTAFTWKAASKDHLVSRPGRVKAEVYGMPTSISVAGTNYCVVSNTVSQTSPLAAHPAIDIGGLRGEYALTGVGATVDWSKTFAHTLPLPSGPVYPLDPVQLQFGAGNLLWKLEPRPDLGGASVASKDHVISSPARITGYATGIKLVPAAAGAGCPIF